MTRNECRGCGFGEKNIATSGPYEGLCERCIRDRYWIERRTYHEQVRRESQYCPPSRHYPQGARCLSCERQFDARVCWAYGFGTGDQPDTCPSCGGRIEPGMTGKS